MSFTASVPHLVATSSSNELVGSIEDDAVGSVHDHTSGLDDDDDDEALERTLDLQVAAAISSQEASLNHDDDDHGDDHDEKEDTSSMDAFQEALTETEASMDTPVVCCICLKMDDRPLVRFLPVEHDMSLLAAAPTVDTFSHDIVLHVFCGKTASILPDVNRPDLEILSKAGLKNKHGIGPEVNAALARTRCATVAQHQQAPKHFYMVREFEAHLAAVRHTTSVYEPPPAKRTKIRCECGGTYTLCRWQAHCRTKRHQQWLEENGMFETEEDVIV